VEKRFDGRIIVNGTKEKVEKGGAGVKELLVLN
jgi:hypothetical protein